MTKVMVLQRKPGTQVSYSQQRMVPSVRELIEEFHTVAAFETHCVGEDAAEEAFDISNNPNRDDEREQVGWKGFSMSVGDIAIVDGIGYFCASSGWGKLP